MGRITDFLTAPTAAEGMRRARASKPAPVQPAYQPVQAPAAPYGYVPAPAPVQSPMPPTASGYGYSPAPVQPAPVQSAPTPAPEPEEPKESKRGSYARTGKRDSRGRLLGKHDTTEALFDQWEAEERADALQRTKREARQAARRWQEDLEDLEADLMAYQREADRDARTVARTEEEISRWQGILEAADADAATRKEAVRALRDAEERRARVMDDFTEPSEEITACLAAVSAAVANYRPVNTDAIAERELGDGTAAVDDIGADVIRDLLDVNGLTETIAVTYRWARMRSTSGSRDGALGDVYTALREVCGRTR